MVRAYRKPPNENLEGANRLPAVEPSFGKDGLRRLRHYNRPPHVTQNRLPSNVGRSHLWHAMPAGAMGPAQPRQ